MKIWIRSQNKNNLSNCNSIYYSNSWLLKEGHFLLSYINGGTLEYLGKYSSKEKALKVLDMLENYIEDAENGILDRPFQMPQDEEI